MFDPDYRYPYSNPFDTTSSSRDAPNSGRRHINDAELSAEEFSNLFTLVSEGELKDMRSGESKEFEVTVGRTKARYFPDEDVYRRFYQLNIIARDELELLEELAYEGDEGNPVVRHFQVLGKIRSCTIWFEQSNRKPRIIYRAGTVCPDRLNVRISVGEASGVNDSPVEYFDVEEYESAK